MMDIGGADSVAVVCIGVFRSAHRLRQRRQSAPAAGAGQRGMAVRLAIGASCASCAKLLIRRPPALAAVRGAAVAWFG
jgi:hypothetical protein